MRLEAIQRRDSAAPGRPDLEGTWHALHSPEKTRRFAGFLGSVSREALERRFDPRRMTELEIDPGTWTREAQADSRLEHVLDAYDDLCAFVQSTTDAKAGLVVYVG